MLGIIPGYYNSATGITATYNPNERFYASYGIYDGNRAREQIGLRGPQFNGYYFQIGEVGYSYTLGSDEKPGLIAVGMWGQTGELATPNGLVNGAQGVYLFGSQRLWFRNPGQDNSGVSAFYQFGANNSNALIARQYFGMGLTAFGLTPGRSKDSMGTGLAWSWLNNDPRAGSFFFPGVPGPDVTQLRTNEMMLQGYYQMALWPGSFLSTVLTVIPNPGVRPETPAALALTAQLVVLF